MIFNRGNIWTTVDGDKSELEKLYSKFITTVSGYVMFEYKTWKRHHFNRRYKRFPSGLLFMALRVCKRYHLDVTVNDCRTSPKGGVRPLPASMDKILHDYQKEAIDAAIAKTCGIFDIATAGGKTITAIGLALRVPGNVLFIVDERSLLRQTAKSWFECTGKVAGVIGDGKFSPKKFTVATFQTLNSKIKSKTLLHYLSSVSCLIIDEVHVTGSRTYWKICLKVKNAYWRIGLSATPSGRSDTLDTLINAATGGVIYRFGIKDLILDKESNRLVPPDIIFYKYRTPEKIESGMPHHDVYRLGIVENDIRNGAIVNLCSIATKPTLLFFESKDHGRTLVRMLENRGMSVEYLDGSASADQREKAKNNLSNGATDILVVSKIFNKGVDIPCVASCINAAGRKSIITATQRLGRGLRSNDEKQRLEYFDLYDRHNSTLKRHTKQRLTAYETLKLKPRSFNSIDKIKEWLERENISVDDFLVIDEEEKIKYDSVEKKEKERVALNALYLGVDAFLL